MKTIHTLLAAMTIAMLAISCENEFDVSDKADSLISVTVNTLNNQAAYNVKLIMSYCRKIVMK